MARVSSQLLSRYADRSRSLSLRVMDAEQEQPLELPAGAVALLMDILEAMVAGRGISLIPENAELTTVQAAEIFNVSRPYLIKLLAAGALSHRKVGTHRRILMEDVMAYKNRIDREREAVLDELAADAQRNDMAMRIHEQLHGAAGCKCSISRADARFAPAACRQPRDFYNRRVFPRQTPSVRCARHSQSGFHSKRR